MSDEPITVRGGDESGWSVYVHGNWIASFTSWQEARDLCVRLEALLAEQEADR